jgi:hypothetical protein
MQYYRPIITFSVLHKSKTQVLHTKNQVPVIGD